MSQTNIDAMRYCANTNLHRLKRQAINSIQDAIDVSEARRWIDQKLGNALPPIQPKLTIVEPKNYCDSDLDELFDNPKDKEWWRI